ncbi:hypothetical protein AB0N65_15505 [Paenarthrobacter sp. NPDC089322]|uniref:hypothetical protein n=1 Tax=Paenarthrobacter sp. NPDC089322 TaxID=3155065 RepID=UPI0034414EB0
MGDNNTPGEHSTPQPARKVTAAVVPWLGMVAVLVGLIVAWINRDSGSWFAYAPLSNEVFTGNGAAFISLGTQIGLAVTVAGLLVLAFWAGLAIGRRR